MLIVGSPGFLRLLSSFGFDCCCLLLFLCCCLGSFFCCLCGFVWLRVFCVRVLFLCLFFVVAVFRVCLVVMVRPVVVLLCFAWFLNCCLSFGDCFCCLLVCLVSVFAFVLFLVGVVDVGGVVFVLCL